MDGSEPSGGKASGADLRREIVAQTKDLRVVEWTLGAGDSLGWHHHSQVVDTFYCLEGLIGIDIRDPPRHVVLHPGQKFVVPAKVVHRPENLGDGRGRFLLIQGLGNYDFIVA